MDSNKTFTMATAVVCLLLAGCAPSDARLLRQVTDSFTGSGVDKSNQIYSWTDNGAEARAQSSTYSLEHNELMQASIASNVYPGPHNDASTPTSQQSAGNTELQIAAFGTVSVATTDNMVAVAAAASGAMPLSQGPGTPGTSTGNTRRTFAPRASKGIGNSHNVQQMSIGVNGIPSSSFSMSEMGDGPNAVASAGQAVASSFSSKTPNTQI